MRKGRKTNESLHCCGRMLPFRRRRLFQLGTQPDPAVSGTEFVILAIAANRSQRGKYAYELPKNVSAVYELYLDDVDWSGSKKLHRKRLKKEQYQALRSLILDQDIEWDVLFDLFQKENVSLNALLMGRIF